MRIGLIADIHGNLIALETVLAELERQPLDRLICLGDVAALGPQPGEVLARLRALQCPVVMGNTDAWLLNPLPATADEFDRAIIGWCLEQLTDSDRAYVATFAPVVELALDDERTLLCFHGSPRSYDDVIVPTTPDDALDEMFANAGDMPAAILAGGHTHLQMMRRYGDAHLINVGSVGLAGVGAVVQRNRHVRWAEYAVVESDGDHLDISLRRTPLDVERMLESARASGMPEIEWWAGLWERR
ncbi:MAG TPA: metallophosphoesterase family protein [Ktedonobacterales bacterium]|nr:metallophosphoesterase family protein [Ktedonobacterales bacterium]